MIEFKQTIYKLKVRLVVQAYTRKPDIADQPSYAWSYSGVIRCGRVKLPNGALNLLEIKRGS